jgi:iron-sulfur cluster assembly protein
MAIQLTSAARERMHDFLAKTPDALGVRFGIKRTGCSGFGYTVDLAAAIAENDRVFEQDGLRLVVDAKALPFVDGTEIDFQRQGLNAAFVFRNPNATGACGCGESFTVGESGPGVAG